MFWSTSGHMGLMGLWWIVAAAAIVAALWIVISPGRDGRRGGESPEQMLKRRYVSGEIDQATYRQMLDELHR